MIMLPSSPYALYFLSRLQLALPRAQPGVEGQDRKANRGRW
jgi:hypothetical protein